MKMHETVQNYKANVMLKWLLVVSSFNFEQSFKA
jgi:hypothetical protein